MAPPVKIALVDIDGTLVRNADSALNESLIQRLKNGGYDQVWLFTGRLASYMPGNLTTDRRTKMVADWPQQLTTRLLQMLRAQGLTVPGVSTQADHTMGHQAGQGWQKEGLSAYEARLLASSGTGVTPAVCGVKEHEVRHDERIQEQVVFQDQSSKKNQAKYLLTHLVKQQPGHNLEIDFFDDHSYNLDSAAEALSELAVPNQKKLDLTMRTHQVTLPETGPINETEATCGALHEMAVRAVNKRLTPAEKALRADIKAYQGNLQQRKQAVTTALQEEAPCYMPLCLYNYMYTEDYKHQQVVLEQKARALQACADLLSGKTGYAEFLESLDKNSLYGESKYACVYARHSGVYCLVEQTKALHQQRLLQAPSIANRQTSSLQRGRK